MKKKPLLPEDLCGVFAVPPLARASNGERSIDFVQNDLLVRHIMAGGIERLIYGGNAFLYHIQLREFAELLEWLSGLPDELLVIPSIGPSYGRAMDQTPLLRQEGFSCAMILPCSDPRDAEGLEQGYREIASAAGIQLIIYLKDENNFGPDREAGLDAVARLVDDGICAAIKYAVVRADPGEDLYLEALLKRVSRELVISGIGERPAVTHLRHWQLPGFTTGSGCIAPALSQALFSACSKKDWEEAEALREKFIRLEDLRDDWGPAKVLHHATEFAGVSRTGPLPPYLTALSEARLDQVKLVAGELVALNGQTGSGSDRLAFKVG